jgi:hypothetical protein
MITVSLDGQTATPLLIFWIRQRRTYDGLVIFYFIFRRSFFWFYLEKKANNKFFFDIQ